MIPSWVFRRALVWPASGSARRFGIVTCQFRKKFMQGGTYFAAIACILFEGWCRAAIGLASAIRQRAARRGFNENLVSRWNAPSGAPEDCR